jgi:hypothetical protein
MAETETVSTEQILRDRIESAASAYQRSARQHAGASTLDTDVAQMLRNLLVENHPAWREGPCSYTTSTADYCHRHGGHLSNADGDCDRAASRPADADREAGGDE